MLLHVHGLEGHSFVACARGKGLLCGIGSRSLRILLEGDNAATHKPSSRDKG